MVMDTIQATFSIYDYHLFWYILGFIIVPRLTLAILLCVYLPLSLIWKIFAVLVGLLLID